LFRIIINIIILMNANFDISLTEWDRFNLVLPELQV